MKYFQKVMKELGKITRVVKKHATGAKKAPVKQARAKTPAGKTRSPLFVLAPAADVSGTHRVTEYRASFKALERAVGKPHHEGDTVEWIFKSPSTGEVVTIYAEPEAHGMSFSELKAAPSVRWSITAREKKTGTQFVLWLRRQR